MKKSHLLGVVCSCALSMSTLTVHAVAIPGQGTWETTLQARDFDGDTNTIEGWYDTVLGITWLADANYAGTSMFDPDGRMNWVTANAWAAGLTLNSITGWRLPTVSPIDGISFNTSLTTDGSSDAGSSLVTTDGTDGGWRDASGLSVSEMGHMFYVTLGNVGRCDPALPFCTIQSAWAKLANAGPFTNIQVSDRYWSDAELDTDRAFHFNFERGIQRDTAKNTPLFAWAVHDGDIGVAVVPVPAAVWLFGSGLIGLFGISRSKKPL